MPAAIPGPPPFANATVAGLVSAVAQTIGGDKTFAGRVINTNPLGLQSYTTGTLPSPASSFTGHLVYNTTTAKVMFSDGAAWVALDVSSGSFVSKTGDTMTGTLTITGAGIVVDSADNTLVVDATNNRVGIGTATPTDRLDVSTGGLAVRGATLATGAGAFLSHASSITTISSVNWTGPAYRDLRLEAQAISLRTGSSSVTERMLVASNGNVAFDTNVLFVDAVNNRVGVLTATPTQSLEVGGVVFSTTGGFRFPDNTTQTTSALPLVGGTMTGALTITGAGMNIAADTLVVDSTNSRVGIGTASPSRTLDVSRSVADHLVEIQNTNVGGASSIAYLSNGGTERLRIGYGNPSFAAPGANVNFWQTDGSTDSIVAHGSTEFHRFVATGNVRFDQADNLLTIDAVNNRIGMGVASPAAGFQVEMSTSVPTGHNLKIRNTAVDGYSSIEFYSSGNSYSGEIGWGNSSVGSGGINQFSIDIPSGLTIRNGTTNHYTFGNGGTFVCNPTDNVLFVAGNTSIRQVGINTSVMGGIAGFTHPFVVDLGTTGVRSQLIRGVGTIRKGLSISDSTNNRTWTIDHATSGNNNRLETWYHDGTSEARILTVTTTGRLGINNVTPTVALDVAGAGQFTGDLIVDTNTLVVDSAGDRVGIGTSPGAGNKLDVAGRLNVTGNAVVTGFVLRSTTTGIAAFAGGGQASATPLTTDVNNVTTVATAADSVRLPTALAGMKILVFNNGANALAVFPATGGQIDSLGVNNSFSVSAGGSRAFFAINTTQWYSR